MTKQKKIYIDPMISPSEEVSKKSSKEIVSEAKNVEIKESREEKGIRERILSRVKITGRDPTHTEYEGIKEATKETAKEAAKNEGKLEELLHKTDIVLHRARNIIPMLTDEIIIDTGKVSVIHRPFFFSERIHSVSIKNISDVYIETAPFLATIVIIDSGFIEASSPGGNMLQNSPVKVKWLWKSEAERARRIITGLLEASKEEIDINGIDDHELANKLEEIGKVKEAKTTVSMA